MNGLNYLELCTWTNLGLSLGDRLILDEIEDGYIFDYCYGGVLPEISSRFGGESHIVLLDSLLASATKACLDGFSAVGILDVTPEGQNHR